MPEDNMPQRKLCCGCNNLKPLGDFLLSFDAIGGIYSNICYICRQEQDDDDGGSGGKQHQLHIDYNAKLLAQKQQEEHNEKITAEKEEYHENSDKEQQDKLTTNKEQAKSLLKNKLFNEQVNGASGKAVNTTISAQKTNARQRILSKQNSSLYAAVNSGQHHDAYNIIHNKAALAHTLLSESADNPDNASQAQPATAHVSATKRK